MKCDECGRVIGRFERYIEVEMGMYVNARMKDWRRRWEGLPEGIKKAYGDLERYLEINLGSEQDTRVLRLCMNCGKRLWERGRR
ncbi:hypothetical protein DRN97_04145 [Methanosarcinales archaeon]|nr:MAG: hypothetical protein DRN97_04145 [Methanosarcinales archaeon]